MGTMKRQLVLIETNPVWRLDERTREVGRRGVAKAREALAAAQHADTADEATPPARRQPSAA